MISLRDILLLGDPRLHQICSKVEESEIEELMPQIHQMQSLIALFQEKYKRGRAIAAPQIGLMKNIIVFHYEIQLIFINPEIENKSTDTFDLWDDCMSFPNLHVWLERHQNIEVSYRDINWKEKRIKLNGSDSELFQHEYDHLNGILAIDRAKGPTPFKWVV